MHVCGVAERGSHAAEASHGKRRRISQDLKCEWSWTCFPSLLFGGGPGAKFRGTRLWELESLQILGRSFTIAFGVVSGSPWSESYPGVGRKPHRFGIPIGANPSTCHLDSWLRFHVASLGAVGLSGLLQM